MHLLAHFGGRQPAPYEGIACASRCLPLCVILSGAIAESNRKARHWRGILHGISYGHWVAEHSNPPRSRLAGSALFPPHTVEKVRLTLRM